MLREKWTWMALGLIAILGLLLLTMQHTADLGRRVNKLEQLVTPVTKPAD